MTVLSEDPDTPESYKKIKGRLNANGLLRRYEEVEDFIRERNKLLEQGVNLEDYWEPVPVRLSLVAVYQLSLQGRAVLLAESFASGCESADKQGVDKTAGQGMTTKSWSEGVGLQAQWGR